MLLKGGKNATVTLTSATGEVTAPSTNMLVGTLVPTAIDPSTTGYINFVLSGADFVKVSAHGTIPANKAYLPVADEDMPGEGGGFARLSLVFIDEAAGIAEIERMSGVENEKVYNLNGQRVSKATKGLYIVNGKKVLFK